MNSRRLRIALGVLSVIGLLIVFLFQAQDMAEMFLDEENFWKFFFGRCIRLILNDGLAILLVFALFYERKYVVFTVWVQLLGIMLVVVPYFIIKYNYPNYNGPWVSFLHRLVLNPTLILLLIPAFYFQRKVGGE